MRHAKKWENVWVRLAALDRAFSYLAVNFPPETTIAVVIRVEFRLAVQWETIQEDLRRRNDPNEWLEISIEAMEEIGDLFAATTPDQSNATAEQKIITMFSKFSPDEAWWTAQRLRRELIPWQKHRIERSKTKTDGNQPMSDIEKVIREAAASAGQQGWSTSYVRRSFT